MLLRGDDPQQRLDERDPRRARRSKAWTAARVKTIGGDLGRDGLKGVERHRRRHPLRRLGLLRAVARRGARAQRQGPDPPAQRAPRSRQRPLLRPRLDRLRRGPAHRPRARAPERDRAERALAGPRRRARRRQAPGAATSRPSRASRSTSTASSRRPSAPSARPAARRSARAMEQLRYAWVRDAADRARSRARPRPRLVGHLHALEGDRRARADGRQPAAAHDRPPGDRRVRARHALPRLDGVAEGRRPDPARLRRRPDPRPLRRQPLDPDGSDPGRLRRQRLPRRRRAPARARHRAHDERGHGHAQPVHDPRHGRDHHAATSASARCPDEDGLPVNVPEWRLSSRGEVITALDRAANVLERAATSSTASRSRAATSSSCGCTRTSARSTACAG